jgi:hypothetical protein
VAAAGAGRAEVEEGVEAGAGVVRVLEVCERGGDDVVGLEAGAGGGVPWGRGFGVRGGW